MFDTNRVELVGTVDRDPKRATTPKGAQKVSFSLAITKKSKGKDFTTWVPCESWHETHCEMVTKGMRIKVDGEFKTDSWEKDGKKQYFSKIHVHEIWIDPKLVKAVANAKGAVHEEPSLPKTNPVSQQRQFRDLEPPSGFMDGPDFDETDDIRF